MKLHGLLFVFHSLGAVVFHSLGAVVSYVIQNTHKTTSWLCETEQTIQVQRAAWLLLLTAKQAMHWNYRVSTPFADNAVMIVFLHCSSVIIMHCELNLTLASGEQNRI